MVQGVGAALLTPASLSLLGHVFTDEAERAKAIGLWSGVSALGVSVGPVIGGPTVDHLGWSSVFWINAPIGVAGVVLAAKVLPEIPSRARKIDYGGFVLSSAGLGLLVYALIEGTSRGWTSAVVLGCGAAGVVLLVAFLVLELRLAEPMLELGWFRDGGLSGALLGAFMVSRMTEELTSSLHRLGGPPEALGPIANAPPAGPTGQEPPPWPCPALPCPAWPGPVRQAVDGAFVDGIHLALRSGSVALAVTAALVAVLLGRATRPQPSSQESRTGSGGGHASPPDPAIRRPGDPATRRSGDPVIR